MNDHWKTNTKHHKVQIFAESMYVYICNKQIKCKKKTAIESSMNTMLDELYKFIVENK